LFGLNPYNYGGTSLSLSLKLKWFNPCLFGV